MSNVNCKTIHWLVPGRFHTPDDLERAEYASTRLRAGVGISSLERPEWLCSAGETVTVCPAVLVIGKIGALNVEELQPGWLRHVGETKARGGKIVLDYTDHHLGFVSSMTAFYKAILPFVDVVVCPSNHMKHLLQGYWRGRVVVIPDAIEVKAIAPKPLLNDPITMFWFGHGMNIPYLASFVETGIPETRKYKLIVLTNAQGIQWWKEKTIKTPPNLSGEMSIWSLRSMIDKAGDSDVCVIPSDASDPKKSGASANRLITALALGLPVAADNLESYLEFRDYYVDIRSEQFAELLENPLAFSGQVATAQKEIVPMFEKRVVAEKWKSLFDGLLSAH